MTLRKRAILAISLSFSCMIIILLLISRFIVLGNLETLEEECVQQNIKRVTNSLDFRLSDLESTTYDWAAWDDTYEFITDVNDAYIESNLIDETLSGLGLNFMLFANSSGEIVFSKEYDLNREGKIPIYPGLQSYFSGDSPLMTHAGNEDGISGILLLSEGLSFMVVSRPILTSEDKGPARGTLVFGRHFDSGEIDRINELMDLSVTAYRIDDSELPDDIVEVYTPLMQDSTILTKILSNQHVAGYTIIEDVYGNPGLILKVAMPRDIYQEGLLSVTYLLAAIIIIGIAFGVLAIVMANKYELSRIKKLARDVKTIGLSGNISERVLTTGKDEISELASVINGMLIGLQELYDGEAMLRQELEMEMKKRSEFTRALVHELKTPLTPMLTSSDMLVSELEQEPFLSLAKNVNRGAVRLNKRIDELLDIARGETGGLQLSFNRVYPLELIHEVLDEMTPQFNQCGLSLELNLPPALSTIIGDEERLRQVLVNLLDNACKFTPEGGKITVRARENATFLKIEVQDSGPGISEEDQENLFDPYFRVENDEQRFHGLGLGLPICKTLVELHGGEIWVESRVGDGSTFGFSVPLETTEPGRET